MEAAAPQPSRATPAPQPVPASSPRPPGQPAAPSPAGWAPKAIALVPSSRRSGLVGAAWDAARGVNEPGAGQALTDAQVGALAPFLASSFELPVATVEADLRATRLYTGGPATRPWWATTIGRDIYVPGRSEMQRILSWEGRRWLAHELGHTMQWRRAESGDGADRDLARTRRMLAGYAAATVLDNRLGPGAVPRGVGAWVGSRLRRDPAAPKLGDAIHDAHWMEREAERHAADFESATAGRASGC